MVMTIDVNAETTELSKVLKLAEGYLSCERIIIQKKASLVTWKNFLLFWGIK